MGTLATISTTTKVVGSPAEPLGPRFLPDFLRSRTTGPAAQDLPAGTSGQLGHPEVASVCRAIAADARRGILAHSRLVQLRHLARS